MTTPQGPTPESLPLMASEPAAEPMSAPPDARPAGRVSRDRAGRLSVFHEFLPFRLRRDVLYLWSTFRLRERPLKMLALIIILGCACWLWEWGGRQYIVPKVIPLLNKIPNLDWRMLLQRTVPAIFSSLNLLSMLSIAILTRSLRRLLKEGHIEALLLTPNRLRPSALFYAISMRYIIIAPMGLLVLYLDPDSSPFKGMPFELGPPGSSAYEMNLQGIADPWSIHWVAINHLSLLLYCVTNLTMDLAFGFWFLARWRPTVMHSAAAITFVGFISPLGILWHAQRIERWASQSPWLNRLRYDLFTSGSDYRWIQSLIPDQFHRCFREFAGSAHYAVASLWSLLIAGLILFALDLRWRRIRSSRTKDPVFIPPVD